MKLTNLLLPGLIAGLLWVQLAAARPLVVSFNPSPADAQGLVLGYGLYYQPTNSTDPNSWYYVSCCGAGNTNFYTDSAFIRGNPVWLTGDTLGRDGHESYFGPPVLFDTNVWLAAVAKAAAKAAGALKIGGDNVTAATPGHRTISLPGVAAAGGEADSAALAVQAAPKAVGISALADGEIQVRGIGASNQICTVAASSSLAAPDWVPIGPAFAEGTNILYYDRFATNYPQRYYRFSLP